jgi:DNA-binding response OmpR family regulator
MLIEQHFNLYVMNRLPEKLLTLNDIMSELELRYGITINLESQIRRAIKSVRKEIFKKTGEDCVIETIPWKGYRLNPKFIKLG